MGGALSDILSPSPQGGQATSASPAESVPIWKLARAVMFWIFMLLSVTLECCFILAPLCALLTLTNLAGFRVDAKDPTKARVAVTINRAYQVSVWSLDASFVC